MTWSLDQLLAGLHDDIQGKLAAARKLLGHPVDKGDASEAAWLELLSTYLPRRYSADKAYVVDSEGKFSDQMDVVVYDRQYSPFIFVMEGTKIIPAESVYAVFEAKQSLNADQVAYAHKKISSVRVLKRTSLPVPHVSGTAKPKPLHHILGGLLTLESDWKPPLGQPLAAALAAGDPLAQVDLGCVAAHGHYLRELDERGYTFTAEGKPATAFLFELIARLQALATVPMVDIRAYGAWLSPDRPAE
ncbi:DUF6602 domain-containing protein [Bosea sp. AS-1]|uniref:DUF6602 domain-containing protein n=1 Tax=Bosea sp. AS-1 TaxID=2015316 RepID=UPI000B789EB7|nr:DUF6602 domain-containing protein [Bosea sp. AS-1]